MTTTGPAAAAGSADVSSSTPFENDLAGMFGDFTTGSAEPESAETSDAGTTPGEPSAGAVETKATGETEAGDGTTKPAGDGTTPDAATSTEPAETDPFADTTPLTFTVNGKQLTNEGIRVFKEGGAVIRPDALPDIQNRLSERESLFERNRAQSIEYQTLAKATEWTDQDGKSYTGPEAAIELRIGNAGLFAENALVVKNIIQSEDLQALLTTKQVADGKGGLREVVIFRPEVIEDLRRENALQQREITAQIRDHYKTVLASAALPAAPSIDFAAEAPKLIAAIAEQAKLDASVLTSADRAILAKHLPRYVEKGHASLEWQELVRDRIQLRAEQKAKTTEVASVTEKATKDAQARMAAAARGVKPASKPTASVKPKAPEPAVERMADEGELFDAMLSSGAKAMRAGG